MASEGRPTPTTGHDRAVPAGPTVSVVIPTFNRRHSVEAAIRSALEQTRPPLEIIVVDDASTDGTDAFVEGLSRAASATSIVLLRQPENRGGGAARNAGVAVARGDLVAFLDSDDRWRRDKLERQVQAWLAADEPASTVVYSQVETRRRGRIRAEPEHGKHDGTSVGDYLFLGGGLMQTSTLLVPRPLAREARIDPDLACHQDFHLCMQLERFGARFVFVEQPFVLYDTDPNVARISGSPDAAPSLLWLRRYGEQLSDAARLGYSARFLARKLAQSGRRGEALRILASAARRGLLSPRETVVLTGRAVVPHRVQQWLKVVLARARAG